MSSHQRVIRKVAEEYDLYQGFVKAIAPVTEERRKMTILHALAGRKPGGTGRYECDHCQCLLREEECATFEESLRWDLDNILKDYRKRYCPKCGAKYTERKRVEIVNETSEVEIGVMDEAPQLDASTFDTLELVEYQCGCRFEVGEEKIIGALDRESLNRDAVNGEFRGWDSQAAKRTNDIEDELIEFDNLCQECMQATGRMSQEDYSLYEQDARCDRCFEVIR